MIRRTQNAVKHAGHWVKQMTSYVSFTRPVSSARIKRVDETRAEENKKPQGYMADYSRATSKKGGRDRTRTYEPHGCEPCALTN